MSSNLAAFTPPSSNAPIDWALAYAAIGMRVFPVKADKKPLTKHGLKDATTDAAQINAWWRSQPYADIGWAVPPGIVVLDADVGKGADGLKEFAAHEGMHPDDVLTPQAQSPRGGRHLVYEANGAVYRNHVRLNGSAIDLRTEGGYIVLPVPGNGRAWLKPLATPLAPAPKWLTPAPEPKPSAVAQPFAGETAYARTALERACLAIEEAPNGAQEATLNKKCFSIGGLIGAGELDYETAISALWTAADGMPAYAEPWRDLEAKVRRAVADGMGRPRLATPEPEPKTDGLIWYGDAPPTPPSYLADETLPEIGVATIGGQYGAAKTFVAADLASAVMAGGDFAGKTVRRKGGVLWLAAEGESEIETRIQAAVAARGADAADRQPFARQAGGVPCLTGKGALERLKALANQAAGRLRQSFNCELALIVIDTLSAAAGFDDENSAAETQKVMNTLTALARETRTLVLVIDHYGKIIETGVRGSSAKTGASDAILACLGDRDPATGVMSNRKIAVTKLRAGPVGRVVPFNLEKTDDGSTCVVRWRSDEPEFLAGKGKPWPKALIIFKRALDEALDAAGKTTIPRVGMPEVKAVDRDVVRTEFFRLYLGDTHKAKKDAFLRCEKDAVERGVMCSINTGPDLAQTIFWTP